MNRVLLYYIQPDSQTHNVSIERFKRTNRIKYETSTCIALGGNVRDDGPLKTFDNEQHPHLSLQGTAPCRSGKKPRENSTYQQSD